MFTFIGGYMSDIKAKDTLKQRIKVIDRASLLSGHFKNKVHNLAKDEEKHSENTSPDQYALNYYEKGIKTISNKTLESAGKTTVKATKNTVKNAKKSVQLTAKATKATAKAIYHGAKIVVKSGIIAIKALIASAKTSIALMVAGGWITVAIIVLICLAALILNSAFGIFYSNEESDSEHSLTLGIQEINHEYENALQDEINSIDYDYLIINENRSEWKNILAVYAVKVNTDSLNAQEVMTLDDSKKQLLKSVFWDMNIISSKTENKAEKDLIISIDENGNITQQYVTQIKTYLHVSVTSKTVEELAEQYNFDFAQRKLIDELLDSDNNALWENILSEIE